MRSLRTKTRTQLGVALLAGLTLGSVACSGTNGELLVAPSDATDATFDATGEMPASDGGHDTVGAVDAADEERARRPDAAETDGADAADVNETSTPVDASTDGESVADAAIDEGTADEGTPDEGTPDGGALDATVTDAGAEDAGAPDANLDAAPANAADASDAEPADASDAAAADASDAAPADAGDAAVDSGVSCNRPEDCPGTDTGCAWRVCDQKQCGMTYVPMDDLSATQTPGDCTDAVCDGLGNQSNIVDSNDVPIDGDPCTSDVCTGGTPSNPPAPAGTSCGGGNVCSGGVCGPRACDAGGSASACH
jgi:hypothetical protein